MRIYSPWRVREPSPAPGPSKIRSADPSDAEHGAVTAEFAVVLPGVTLVLALCLGAVATGAAQVRLEDAARAAARAAARGDAEASIHTAVSQTDRDAAVSIAREGNTVRVSAERKAPGVIGATTGWTLRAQATASVEGSEGLQDTEEAAHHEE